MKTAKDFVESVSEAVRAQDVMKWQVEEARGRLEVSGMVIDSLPKSPNSSGDQIPNVIDSWYKIASSIEEDIFHHCVLLEQFEQFMINLMVEGYSQEDLAIIRMKFLFNKSWSFIADALYMSPSRIRHRAYEILAATDGLLPLDVG